MNSSESALIETLEIMELIIEMTIDRGSSKSNDHIIDRKTDYSNDTSNWSQDKLTLYFETKDVAINGSMVALNVVTDDKHPPDGSFTKQNSNCIKAGCQHDCFELYNKSLQKYIALDLSDENQPKLIALSQTEKSLKGSDKCYRFSMSMYSSGRIKGTAEGNIALFFTIGNCYYYLTPNSNASELKIVREERRANCNDDEMFKNHMWFTDQYINSP